MPKTDGLTIKQKRFIDFYIQSANASDAARKAGYSAKSARYVGLELLQKPNVQAAIATRLAELDSERTADTKEILEYLTMVMRGDAEEEVVVNVGTGKGFTRADKVKAQVGAKDRLKAAEMLAKVHGMFISKSELEISGTIPVVIRDDL